jgi:hypothetical protein
MPTESIDVDGKIIADIRAALETFMDGHPGVGSISVRCYGHDKLMLGSLLEVLRPKQSSDHSLTELRDAPETGTR